MLTDVLAIFANDFPKKSDELRKINEENFDENEKIIFLKGAKIAYENIITNFSSGEIKNLKSLLHKNVLDAFSLAIKDRKSNGLVSETTFIGINSAIIKNYAQKNKQ